MRFATQALAGAAQQVHHSHAVEAIGPRPFGERDASLLEVGLHLLAGFESGGFVHVKMCEIRNNQQEEGMTENEAFDHAITLTAAFVANGDLRMAQAGGPTIGVPSDRLRDVIAQLQKDVLAARDMCKR